MSDKVKYWLELAEYDLETAKVMLDGGRYLYVGFMCHQAIEKMLKGYCVSLLMEDPPFTHNLTILAKKSGIFASLSDQHRDTIDLLEPLNVEARYPTVKDKLLKVLTEERCLAILDRTEGLFAWIKAEL
ncbi:MAG: HEPN domain-containing protein [Firmicutes bacterium]|nr:HEPN domain-containing protein [Bacillota bacterium]